MPFCSFRSRRNKLLRQSSEGIQFTLHVPERLDLPAGVRPSADQGDGREGDAAAWRELECRHPRRAAFHRSRYGVDRTDARDAAAGVAPAHGEGSEPLSLSTEDARRRLAGCRRAPSAGSIPGRRGTWRSSRPARPCPGWRKVLGVTLREIAGERFVVLPAGTLDYPPGPWTGRPALKPSSERGNSMTALERLLMRALRRLSERSAARVPSGFAIEGSVHAL